MSQSNSRQMTHIRDFRWSVSEIAKAQFALQRHFGSDDPTIEMFDPSMQGKIRNFLSLATQDRIRRSFFEIKASDPAQNKEVDRQNLLQEAQILSQYGQQLVQMVGQYQMSSQKNPLLGSILRSLIGVQRDMAVSLARAFDQLHIEGKLPDFERLLNEEQQRAAGQQGLLATGANGGGLRGVAPGGLQQTMADLQEMALGVQ
jgi:hypothetical protein